MSDIKTIRDYLEQRHPLVNALVAEMFLRPQGEEGDQALRFVVPRPDGDHALFTAEAIIPAEAFTVEDEEEREYAICVEAGAFAKSFERVLAKALREEKRPLATVALFEPERVVDPREFQCGDSVNLNGRMGIVCGLDFDSGDVIVRAQP